MRERERRERGRERAGRESKLVGCSLVLASHFQVSVGREGWNRRLGGKKVKIWFEQVEPNSSRVEAKELLRDKSIFAARTLLA